MLKSNFQICGNRGPRGETGYTPYIGKNGNWWINEEDTGKPSRGPRGQIGYQGYTPYVGENGNWWINGEDTGKPSRGLTGDRGPKGEKGEKGDNGVITPEVIGEIKKMLEKSVNSLDLYVNDNGHLILRVDDNIELK